MGVIATFNVHMLRDFVIGVSWLLCGCMPCILCGFHVVLCLGSGTYQIMYHTIIAVPANASSFTSNKQREVKFVVTENQLRGDIVMVTSSLGDKNASGDGSMSMFVVAHVDAKLSCCSFSLYYER